MGVSIKLYRIKKANEIGEIKDLENELTNAEEYLVDLYKVYHDILMVLLDSIEPYRGEKAIENKAILGNKINIQVGNRQCVGFIPSVEVNEINEWIMKRGIEAQ